MKRFYILMLFIVLLLLVACTKEEVTSDFLLEGKWVATSGYEEGEITGEPMCKHYDQGIEFIDDETVYVKTYDENFDYFYTEGENGQEINFRRDTGLWQTYYIGKEDENGFTLVGIEELQEGQNCYMERQTDG